MSDVLHTLDLKMAYSKPLNKTVVYFLNSKRFESMTRIFHKSQIFSEIEPLTVNTLALFNLVHLTTLENFKNHSSACKKKTITLTAANVSGASLQTHLSKALVHFIYTHTKEQQKIKNKITTNTKKYTYWNPAR